VVLVLHQLFQVLLFLLSTLAAVAEGTLLPAVELLRVVVLAAAVTVVLTKQIMQLPELSTQAAAVEVDHIRLVLEKRVVLA
jgi:hypothetical protein